MFRYIGSERIVGIGRAKECLDGEKDSADLEGRRPLVCPKIEDREGVEEYAEECI